ncbi:MAG: ABC transporter permease subunit [Rhodospirillaceae bacterium]|nr:ABC transporter permease subunit [Rhodospirillaceae bacterium]
MKRGLSWFVFISLILGFVFLYAPILVLIVFSFNKSKLVTVWQEFSFDSYINLLHNQQILDAAWVSLKVASISATLAAILGTMCGYVLSRFSRFRGRILFLGLVSAPLVMPEVITGLAMLLMFIQLDQILQSVFGIEPVGRGLITLIIAHTTFATAYVAVVVQSRLAGFDRSLEEAAADLGAKPYKVFFFITLPIIAPGIIAGWLLAFTLSLDDVVISDFTSGPGASTLPLVIFSKVRLGISPEINALATILILIVGTGIIAANIIGNHRAKRERREMQIALTEKAVP